MLIMVEDGSPGQKVEGPESRQSRSGSCRDDNSERRSWGSPGPCLLSSAACEMLRAGVGTDAHLANPNQGAEGSSCQHRTDRAALLGESHQDTPQSYVGKSDRGLSLLRLVLYTERREKGNPFTTG